MSEGWNLNTIAGIRLIWLHWVTARFEAIRSSCRKIKKRQVRCITSCDGCLIESSFAINWYGIARGLEIIRANNRALGDTPLSGSWCGLLNAASGVYREKEGETAREGSEELERKIQREYDRGKEQITKGYEKDTQKKYPLKFMSASDLARSPVTIPITKKRKSTTNAAEPEIVLCL